MSIEENKNWYRLDTAAKLYPSISQTHNNATFRLALELYEEVNKELLQQALVKIMPRFPTFAATLKRGMFWYYLEPNDALPIVKEDSGFPCKRLKDFINNGFLFNVTYYKKNVMMECFHGLADGAGAIEFLKTLMYEYFELCGYDMDSEGMVLDSQGKIGADELDNSFVTYYDESGDARKLKQPQAYHVMGTPNEQEAIFVTHGIIDLKEFLAHVKKKGVTVTAYVSALLICCIAKQQGLEYRKDKRPVIVSVPVDLRNMFPSHTLRNFMSYANIGVEINGKIEFDEILKSVAAQLKDGLSKEKISAAINKNVQYEKNPFIRMTPLFVKNIVVSNTYKVYGEGCYTLVLSNLRTAQFPETMRRRIKQVYYTLGVSELNPINCVLVSYEDKMVMTFARGIEQTEIIRYFFEHFSKELKMKVEMRGNEWSVTK
ncbi:MAG: hypothetical protein RR580_03610 [Christensenellaceae bacterium]